MRTRHSRHAGRAFTLIEIMVVISIILVLASLVLGVGSALLRRAERSQVESAMTIMESAFTEWEGQTGRPVTYNGAFDAAMVEQWPSADSTVEIFDVRDPGAPPLPPPPQPADSASKQLCRRAGGVGVFTVNLLFQVEAIRVMLAGISSSLLRPEANSPTYPTANIPSGPPPGRYEPSAKSSAGARSSRTEFVDTWGNRIAFLFPGRAYRFGTDSGVPDADGTVRTPFENVLGVCTNRRICLVSAGPDGLFGVPGESTPDSAAIQNTAAADNIYLYELDPPN